MKKGFLNSKAAEAPKPQPHKEQDKEILNSSDTSPRDVTLPPPPAGNAESPSKGESSMGENSHPNNPSAPQPSAPQPSATQPSSPQRPPPPPKPARPQPLSPPDLLRLTEDSATLSWAGAEAERLSGKGKENGAEENGAERLSGLGLELEVDLSYELVVRALSVKEMSGKELSGKELSCSKEPHLAKGSWNPAACAGKGGWVAHLSALTPGTKYSAKVVISSAEYGNIEGQQRLFTTPSASPQKPTNPSVSGKGKSWIKLRWPVPEGRGEAVGYYQVEMGAANHGVKEGSGTVVDHAEVVYTGTEPKCEIKNLRPGISYGARVRAQNSVGWSEYSSWTVVATSATVPQPPGQPFIAQLGIEWMQIAWQPPMDNGGMEVDCFVLEISDGSEASPGWSVAYRGPDLSFLLQNAVPGHKYAFRVKASNGVGTSSYSTPMEANGCCGPPGPPTNIVQIGDPSPFSMQIGWAPPLKDNGSSVQIYQVAMRRIIDGMPVGYWEPIYSGPGTTCEVNGLFPASLFEFGVVAISALGTGPPCPSVCFATSGAPPTAPPPPFLLGSEEGRLQVGWNLPDLCNGAPVTSFRLESIGPEESMSCLLYEGSSISHWIDGLAPGINVWLRVAASNAHGTGPPSHPSCFTTQCIAPSSPSSVYSFDIGKTHASLAWHLPQSNGGSPILGYHIQVTRKDKKGQEPIVLESNVQAVSLDSLSLGATYAAKVSAGNAIGYGSWSEEHVFTTEPGPPCAPEAPNVEAVTSETISLSWNQPISHQLAPVEFYTLQMHNGKEYQTMYTGTDVLLAGCRNAWNDRGSAGSLLAFQVGSLQPGSQYKFRVRAGNSKGESGYSGVAVATTDAVVPGPPLALTMLGVASNSIKFKWNAPAFQGGSSIYAYSVMMREELTADSKSPNRKKGVQEAKEVWSGPATTCKIKCNAESAYEIWVVALNAVGAGAASSSMKVSTPAVQAVPLVPKAPSSMPPPTLHIRNTTMSVSWLPPKDAIPPARQYFLQISSDDTEDQEVCVGNATAHEISGLTPGVVYHVRVSAENDQGRSNWSGTSTTSIKSVPTKRARVVPQAPTQIELEKATKSSLRFKWQTEGEQDGDGFRFKLELAEGGGSYVTAYTGTECAFTVMKLNPDSRYRARVQAINKYGSSAYCEEISVRTNAIPGRSWHRIAGYFFSILMILVLLYYFLAY